MLILRVCDCVDFNTKTEIWVYKALLLSYSA